MLSLLKHVPSSLVGVNPSSKVKALPFNIIPEKWVLDFVFDKLFYLDKLI